MTFIAKEFQKVVGTRPIRPDGVDKVTGRANFGADMVMPGMLWGKVKRSPHAHARILSINTEKAKALPGVKAVITWEDFPPIPSEEAFVGEGPMNFRDLSQNCMARDKALYDGHAVAAVAAISPAIAEQACELIEVDYHVLPHVIDVEEAMKPDAPLLHDDLFTQGVDPKPTHPSNIAKRVAFAKGDIDAGFREADVIIERRYTTKPVHQAYIEPHACVVSMAADGQCTIWSSSQGQFMVRAYCAKLLGIDISQIRAIPAEIGGGFGGKTLVYLEPLALAMAKKSGRPVKMVMSREEVFRGTGPTSGGVIEVKIGAKKDGTIVAADLVLKYQAGAFPGSPVGPGCMCGFAMYDIPNVNIVGYDVVSNRPKVAAYRAPGAPISSYRRRKLPRRTGRPARHRPAVAAREERRQGRHQDRARADLRQYRLCRDRRRGQEPPASEGEARPQPGPRHRLGLLVQHRRRVRVRPATSTRTAPRSSPSATPDIGGSRASMAMMAAEVLGIPVEQVRPIVADTSSIGFSFLTGGSRVTFATGMAATQAAEKVVERAEEARRDDLGHQPRRGRMEGRQGLSRPAPTPAASSRCRWPISRSNRAAPAGRSAPRCRSTRKGRAPALRRISAMSRSIRRPATSRSCAIPRCRMSAGRSIPPMSRGRSRAA